MIIPTHIIVSMYNIHSSIKIPKGNSDVNEGTHIFRKIAYVYIFHRNVKALSNGVFLEIGFLFWPSGNRHNSPKLPRYTKSPGRKIKLSGDATLHQHQAGI